MSSARFGATKDERTQAVGGKESDPVSQAQRAPPLPLPCGYPRAAADAASETSPGSSCRITGLSLARCTGRDNVKFKDAEIYTA
jgi:hypothetical protein